MLDVILYTKAGCGLCEDVKAELQQLRAAYPHILTEVDITKDRELFARYRFMIPVVEIGSYRLKAPIAPEDLERGLRKASSAA